MLSVVRAVLTEALSDELVIMSFCLLVFWCGTVFSRKEGAL